MVLPTQGMMLSERPSEKAGDSTATAGPGVALAATGSIGNYKGVMLCNRPFTGTAMAAKGGAVVAAAAKNVFLTGVVKSELGYSGRALQTDNQPRKRVKKETALTRHKRWLADLQLTKHELEEQYMVDERKKEETKKRFAEREARIRRAAREFEVEEGNGGDTRVDGNVRNEEHGIQAWDIGLDDDVDELAKAKAGDIPRLRSNEGRNCHNEKGEKVHSELFTSRTDSAELRAAEKRRKRDGNPCRPKWAMTERNANAEDELDHEQELDKLLGFTRGLDFEKYIRDAEIQSMINQIKKRIIEIEKQPDVDERYGDDNSDNASAIDGDKLDETEAKIMKLTVKNLRDIEKRNSNASVGTGVDSDVQPADDNMSVARTALSEGGWSLRSIHSTRSLAAVAEKARGSISAARAEGVREAPSRLEEGPNCNGVEPADVAVNDIVVVTHKDDGGLRLGGKNNISNLPYIRRNPAV